MIVAREKRKNNVAEYILYMWYVEDLIRACNMEFTIIKEKIISGYKTDIATKHEISEWYQELIHLMIQENITVSGHFQFLNKLIHDLNSIHEQLLLTNNDKYLQIYNSAKPSIELFRTKSNNSSGNDIEICLNALHSYLFLKISKKEISDETAESMKSFSSLLSILSFYFRKLEEGDAHEKN